MKYLVQALAPHSSNGPAYAGNDGRTFTIAAAHSGLALMSADGQTVTQGRWEEDTHQQWKVVANGDGSFRIANAANGKVLDVLDASTSEGATVYLHDWVQGPNQRWRLIEATKGHFEIIAAHSIRGLEIEGDSKAEGAKVEQGSLRTGFGALGRKLWRISEVRAKSVLFDKSVTIFQHDNYAGKSQKLGLGAWDMEKLTFGNDTLSSARVPAGLRLTIYEHANFRGGHVSFTADVASVGSDWNDQASGVIVEKVATIYEHADYQGKAIALGVGRYDLKRFGLSNDQLSSIKVPHGLVVTLYEDSGFSGDYRAYFEDTGYVGDFNDKTSSIIVKQIGVLIPEGAVHFGGTVRLKGFHDKYLVAEADGRVRADRADASLWETFTVYRAGPGTHKSLLCYGDIIALKTYHDKFVSATAGGDATANATTIGKAEKFEVIRAGASSSSTFVASGDRVALRSVSNGKHLVGEDDGDANVNRENIGDLERFTLTTILSTTVGGTTRVNVCAAEACATDVCGAAACAADACGAAACGAAATLVGTCGTAAVGIALCGMDVTGVGACGAAACGAAAVGIVACGADACGAAACAMAACGAAACGAAACGADACGADVAPIDVCGAALCGADVGGIDACGADACGANVCGINACAADACAADACGLDVIPVIPGI